MPNRQSPIATERSRELRKRQTEAESLLWNVLRARRLSGLMFRRQYPIEPWIIDFACLERQMIVEIDGGYHDQNCYNDMKRQGEIEALGFMVIRFTNEEVLTDVEAVAIAIARQPGVEPLFAKRSPSPRPSPPNRLRSAKK